MNHEEIIVFPTINLLATGLRCRRCTVDSSLHILSSTKLFGSIIWTLSTAIYERYTRTSTVQLFASAIVASYVLSSEYCTLSSHSNSVCKCVDLASTLMWALIDYWLSYPLASADRIGS